MPFRTRKALGLLVYLAVETRPHVRDGLADLLWSRAAPAEARHSLANAISEIRRRLGKSAVETSGDRVRLRPDLLTLDLERLLGGDVLGGEVDGPLEVDGFLEGFDLPDAVEFAHWREVQRAALVPPIRDALVTLIDRARRTGNFPELGRLGERLARFDELSEDAVRARMESRAFAGDRLGALRLFEHWKVELSSQMGAVPSELLEGMSLRLRRRGWERPGGVNIPAVRTEQWRDRPFVGRVEEYRELYEAWESTRRGEPRHRLLLGDSGVGKSTLVERITSVAALEGGSVVRTQCHEVEHELPYAAISELIIQLVDRPGASATPPEQLAELAQHITAVRRRFSNLPETLATQGEASRVRFSEAAYSLMQAVSEERPLVVVVDDVHNCDDVSLAVLHFVLRHSANQPLLVILAARPGELRHSGNALRLVERSAVLGLVPLFVNPLAERELSLLLDRLLSDDPQTHGTLNRRSILTACGGVPLVLELLLREWRQSGGASLVFQLDAITPDASSGDRFGAATSTYRMVLDRLFAGLESDTKAVLYIAAVLGRHLNDPSMYSLADLTTSKMLHGLRQLTDLRLLRDGGTGLEFANDLVRAQAYVAIPTSLRQLLHGRVADALIDRAQRGEPGHGLDISWHCMRSGRPAEAMDFLLDGAKGAIARGAVCEAEFRLRSALDNFEGAKRTEAILTLARLIQEQSRYDDSIEVLKLDESAAASVEGQLYKRTALVATNQMLPSELVDTIALMQQAVAVRPINRHAARIAIELTGILWSHAYEDALIPELLSVIAAAEEASWPSEDQVVLALARLKLQFNAGMTGAERQLARRELEELVERTGARQNPSRRSCSLVSGIGILMETMGDIEGSLQYMEASISLASRLENFRHLASAYANLALKNGWLGNYQRQREWAGKVLGGQIAAAASVYNLMIGSYEYALGSAMLGDHLAARRMLDEQHAIVPTTATTALHQTWMLQRADIAQLLGDESQALRLSEDALELASGAVLARRTTTGAAARALLRIRRASGASGRRKTSELLDALFAIRARMDATEAVELLSAYLISFPEGDQSHAAREELRVIMQVLPKAAARRLEALGTPPPVDPDFT